MPEPNLHDIELPGCTPEPLMAYLKALGILRLVSEQADPGARGWWQNDVFWLRAPVLFQDAGADKGKQAALAKFFLNDYKPTPIVVPWSGGDFFAVSWNEQQTTYSKTPTSSNAIESILNSRTPRFESYRNALRACKAALDQCGIDTKEKMGKRKWTFIQKFRSFCDESGSVDWTDAAAVTGVERFAGLLGSGGGSDGNTHFSDNFMQNLWDVLPDFDHQRAVKKKGQSPTADASKRLLIESLFRIVSNDRVIGRTSSLFDSGAVGGPNATHGMERDALSNPWDVVFALEGAVCFAGAAVKRLDANATGDAAFPFQVPASVMAREGLVEKEHAGTEVWLPIWDRPAQADEILLLLREGRAQCGTRRARSGVDMARSAATLGTDRGIRAFHRYVIVKGRVGGDNYNTAASLGRFDVRERPEADLFQEIDPWLDSFRRAAGDKNVPARFNAALRGIDTAVFDFCRYGGKPLFQKILVALGRAERELALTPGKVGQSKSPPQPLAGLSKDWVAFSHDDSQEFQIAQALAGVYDSDRKIGSLRANIEPVVVNQSKDYKAFAKWAEKDRTVVWTAADLSTNLAAVLDRRVMDGERKGCNNLPLASHATTSPAAIAAFLAGDLDDERIENLLWGLMLVDGRSAHVGAINGPRLERPRNTEDATLPSIYCLLKLLFLPRPLVSEHRHTDRVNWRLAKREESGTHRIRPEPAILALLRSGRAGEAAFIAMRRLRASGLTPLPHRRSGGVSRDHEWIEVRLSSREGRRLAAALLIPIHAHALDALVQQATRADDVEDRTEPLVIAANQGE